MEEQQHMQQAIAEYVDQRLKARGYTPARNALEETGRKESTQAQDKEPRSSKTPTAVDPVLEIARKSTQEKQQRQQRQQVKTSTCVEKGDKQEEQEMVREKELEESDEEEQHGLELSFGYGGNDEEHEEEVERVRVETGRPPQLTQAAKPEQQQQQPASPPLPKLLATPAKDPWPPPNGSGERGLVLGRRDIFVDGFGIGGAMEGSVGCSEHSSDEGGGSQNGSVWERAGDCGDGNKGGGAPDGSAWERIGIGTWWSCSSTFARWGCEVAGRRRTRLRRARVREK